MQLTILICYLGPMLRNLALSFKDYLTDIQKLWRRPLMILRPSLKLASVLFPADVDALILG